VQYNRLGLYLDSLELLNCSYPKATFEDSEPGSLVFRGSPACLLSRILPRKAGPVRSSRLRSGLPDAASLNIFPSTPDEITVLHAALTVNTSDASAHFLQAPYFFPRGIVADTSGLLRTSR
jgi:hypothetical protein